MVFSKKAASYTLQDTLDSHQHYYFSLVVAGCNL